MTTEEKLERLTQSHVALMTDFEVAWSRHKEFVEEQDKRWKQYDAWREQEKERGAELDKRIEQLVSGIGEFIRKAPR
jgi:hypothetical protein